MMIRLIKNRKILKVDEIANIKVADDVDIYLGKSSYDNKCYLNVLSNSVYYQGEIYLGYRAEYSYKAEYVKNPKPLKRYHYKKCKK